jgi:hypothetical protein
MHPAETGLLIPSGKSHNRTLEVTLHIPGKHVHEDLGVLRIEYLAEHELLNELFENASLY